MVDLQNEAKCTQTHRISRLESDVRDLQDRDKKHDDDITGLKEGQAESRLFQKMITEQLAEIKMILNAMQKRENIKSDDKGNLKIWLDAFKWVIGATIGAIVLYIFGMKGGV